MFKLKLETIKRSWPKVDNTPKSFYLKHLKRNTKIILVMLVNNLQKEEMFLAIKTETTHLCISFPNWLSSKRWSNYPWKWMFMTGHFCCRETPSRFFLLGIVDYNLKLASFLICFVIQFGQVLSASWEFLYQFSHMKCEERIMQNPP